jgi:hypothetical protein
MDQQLGPRRGGARVTLACFIGMTAGGMGHGSTYRMIRRSAPSSDARRRQSPAPLAVRQEGALGDLSIVQTIVKRGYGPADAPI